MKLKGSIEQGAIMANWAIRQIQLADAANKEIDTAYQIR